MHTLSAWFTRNPVAANLLMLLFLVGGFFSLSTIRIEGFPALPPSSLTITTFYPGASAEQVDRAISRRIETALEGMAGVKKIATISSEGYSTVWVQKQSKANLDRLQADIKTRIDGIATMPTQAERPIINRDEFNVSALLVQVYGDTDEMTLQQTARIVKEELLADPHISKLTQFGKRDYEIRIEVDTDKLNGFGLSLAEVAAAIDKASLDYRTGILKSEEGRILLRADKKAFYYEDFIHIPLRTLSDGSRLLLHDVATIIDGFDDEDGFARFQGKPSVGMELFTTPKGHLLEVSKAAHQVVDSLHDQLPATVQIDIWGDYSVYMQNRLNLLQTNGWQGLLIVFALLALFLNLKLAFWVAMGIPISVAGVLALMGERFLNYSLNDITTFGLIIVLGILVDDAVVVGESVFEERAKGGDPVEATIKGVAKVSTATVFGCFTTIAAFYPLLLIDNDLGKIFASFSVVVIIALLFSLVESKLILPAHLAALSVKPATPRFLVQRIWAKAQKSMSWLLGSCNRRIYQPFLGHVLRHRYSALIFFASFAALSMSLVLNGQIRTVFFPEIPGDIISVTMKMNNGSAPALTVANIKTIEEAAEQINQELMKEMALTEPPIARIMTALTDTYSSNIYAELQPEKKRMVKTLETLERWRQKVGELEGVEELSFSGSFETGGGFVIELISRDESLLPAAVAKLSARLKQIEGVSDVRNDLRSGEPQIKLRLKKEAAHLGLTQADLASQIGDAYGGLEIHRLQRDAEEVKVTLKVREDQRRYLHDLLNTLIQIADGQKVVLSSVAQVESGYAPGTIVRRNSKRSVQIKASINKELTGADKVFATLGNYAKGDFRAKYPGVTLQAAGELEEMGEMNKGLIKALLLILLLIYTLLAIPLKSYLQPLIIMAIVPFGFAGAVMGHKIAGVPLSVLSFFGMLALAGVVINDSLVMLTRFNALREEGLVFSEALIKAGGSRFRAIFLTTVTTTCGLLPLLLETSEQAQYLIPAAISLAYGELFATPVTLLLIPVLLHISDDCRLLFAKCNPFRGKVAKRVLPDGETIQDQ